MKKVLIISYAFPPHQAIGSQRPFRLAKYFPQYGWEPVVLTVDRPGKAPQGIKIIKAVHKNIFSSIKSMFGLYSSKHLKGDADSASQEVTHSQVCESKFYRFIKEAFYFPDPQKGWYKIAVKSASAYLDKEGIDAIISTSSPETDHLIAKKIKQKYKIPWIADFRDPWTQNVYKQKFPLIKYLERRLELKTLSDADAIVTVTKSWIDLLGSLHKGKDIYCVTNGYDEDDFNHKTVELTNKFTITYAGSLYQGKRDPSLLLEVLNELMKEKKIERDLIEVRFYGDKDAGLTQYIKKCNMEDIVHFYGKVPREEVINKLMESQLLLLLLWDSKNESGFCPAKLYEYFGARRPIIATGWSGSVVKDHLRRTGAGKFADNQHTLRSIILEYYREFIRFGQVKGSTENIEQFTYASIAGKYSEILDKIILAA